MDCLVLPMTILTRRFSGSRLGYQSLSDSKDSCGDDRVTVVVGKEKREFVVDPSVLKETPFRVLIDLLKKDDGGKISGNPRKRVIFVDVDAILFEHMLWLMHNDCSSLLQLNLKEIVDFYAQDY